MTATKDLQPTTAPRPELVGIVPEVPPLRAVRLPAVAERTLGNGLRLIAARRSGVPRLEARMLVPAARNGKAPDAARARVFGRTLLAGTRNRSSVDIAQELQRIGGNLDAGVDAEDFVIHGSTLSSELPRFLALLSEVLTEATHPADEVALQREVTAQEITLALSQPATLARQALLERLFGSHPYGDGLPTPESVAAVKAGQLRKLGDKRLRPEGSILVLVGDVAPNRALDLAEAAFASWEGGGGVPGLAAPAFSVPAPTLLIDRPGSVQTNIRIGGAAIGRTHPDYPKLALANLVFGGYFVSRLVDNIREKRGYTYSPGSGVTQNRAASYFFVQADVGTEVTAPALVEIRYELLRMLAGPIEPAELLSAKRYLSGTISMSIQTQAGLAGFLASLAVSGQPIEYLREFPAAVDALTEDEVIEASREYLDPRKLDTVLVGDAATIQAGVEASDEVELGVTSNSPFDLIGRMAIQEVRVSDTLAHIEVFTLRGLLTMLWHGARDAERVVVMAGGAMGGLLGPSDGAYHDLGVAFAEQGIGTIRVGYRMPNDLPECILDVAAACDLAARAGAERFVTVGHSFGGAVAVGAGLALPDHVKGVVTLATQSAGCEGAAELWPRPLLLLHGGRDEILPVMCSELVSELAGGGELVVLPGAGHLLNQGDANQVVRETLLEWIPPVLEGEKLRG